MQRVHYFPEDVELQLIGRSVANAYGFRVLETGQSLDLGSTQDTFAAQPVHDLHLGWTAGGGPQQPIAPRRPFLELPGVPQREQRERRVAEPAEAVIPVTRPAQLLGQRRRGRGND